MQRALSKLIARPCAQASAGRLLRSAPVLARHVGTSPVPLPHGPDPEGLMEYSVVYTDRALNHMSGKFQKVMNDLSQLLKEAYKCDSVAIIPGSGSYGMEAVARQFGTGQKCLVIRNGFFSFRWSQILQAGSIATEEIVLKAKPAECSAVQGCSGSPGDCPQCGANPSYAPPPVAEVVATILRERPGAVFAPHVETSAGVILPDSYIKEVAAAVHEVGGIFVLDGIASGCVWVDMADLGVDVFISAPQKGWSGPACAGLVMMNQNARTRMDSTTSTSFAIDLAKWTTVMEAYEKGGHMYYCTMPTDALTNFRDTMVENLKIGMDTLKKQQFELGDGIRSSLAKRGFKSVAAEGFGAPGVVVMYTADDGFKSGAKFAKQGMQIAGGVPLMVDDFTSGGDFKTFRLGLFGLDKLQDVEKAVKRFEETLDKVEASA